MKATTEWFCWILLPTNLMSAFDCDHDNKGCCLPKGAANHDAVTLRQKLDELVLIQRWEQSKRVLVD